MLFNQVNRKWTAEEVSKELRTNVSFASNQLSQLTSKGLLTVNESREYSYEPKSDELHEKLSRLNDLYKEKPVAIVTAIFEKPQEKLRDFSDAFKIKKD